MQQEVQVDVAVLIYKSESNAPALPPGQNLGQGTQRFAYGFGDSITESAGCGPHDHLGWSAWRMGMVETGRYQESLSARGASQVQTKRQPFRCGAVLCGDPCVAFGQFVE